MSLDVPEELFDALQERAQKMGTTGGRYLAYLMHLIFFLPDEVRLEMSETCRQKAEELEKLMPAEDSYTRDKSIELKKSYEDLMLLFQNRERPVKKELSGMQIIRMKTRILQIPADWILLDLGDPATCDFAGVVEIQNGETYGTVDHAVFFCEGQTIDDGLYDRAIEACKKQMPHFQDILDAQVEPAYEYGDHGKILNLSEYQKSPRVGIFSIPYFSDRRRHRDVPYDAFLYPKEKN